MKCVMECIIIDKTKKPKVEDKMESIENIKIQDKNELESSKNLLKFTSDFQRDHKHILNTNSDQIIDQKILNQIEAGITYETLQELKKSVSIFEYYTQITVHGIFSELQRNYLYGYKFLFQNKNLSIGIKYNAIDQNKIDTILNSERYQLSDFGYHTDSNSRYFQIRKRINNENKQDVYNELIAIQKRLDNLYIGSGYIDIEYRMYGTYLLYVMNINAIREQNASKFIDNMLTDTEYSERKKQKLQEEQDKINRDILKTENLKKAEELKKAAVLKSENYINWLNKNFVKTDNSQPEQNKYYLKAVTVLKNDKNEVLRTWGIEDGKAAKSEVIYNVLYFKKENNRSKKITGYSFDFENLKTALEIIKSNDLQYFTTGKYNSLSKVKLNRYLIEFKPVAKTKENAELANNYKDIELIDYSDNAVALVGLGTYSIKENLKALGMRFNRFLKVNNKTVAGWIGSITLKDNVLKIMENSNNV